MEEKDQIDQNESSAKVLEDQNIELKVKSSRRRKLGAKAPKIFRIILAVFFIIAIFALFVGSGLFKIDEVEVTNEQGRDLRYVNDYEVTALISDEYVGENFFFVDPNESKSAVISKDPYIQDLWVEKVAPRKLHVYVIEKEKSMYIKFEDRCILIDNNNFFIVDHPIVALDEGEEQDIVDCTKKAQEEGVLFVDFKGDHYEFIIKEGKFFLFENIEQVRNMLKAYGIEVNSMEVGDRLLRFNTSDGKFVLIDPFDDFDIQLKRLALILNQIRWVDQNFLELDVRYKRPVMRNEASI